MLQTQKGVPLHAHGGMLKVWKKIKMPSLLKSLVFCVTICSSTLLLSQNQASLENVTILPYIVQLDLCDARSHIYTHVDFVKSSTNANKGNEISYLKLVPSWDPTKTYLVQKKQNGFEIDLYNQYAPKGNLTMEISGYDSNNNQIFSKQISKNAKQEGIVDVSPHMDKLLGEFQKTRWGLDQFFCDKMVSQIELLAFFKDYLKLTDFQMCEMIRRYNLLSRLELQNQVSYPWRSDLCSQFHHFLTSINGPDEPSDGDNCVCNLIRTNRSALNIGSGNAFLDPADQCNDYIPRLFAKNYEFNSNEDDCIISEGRLGAAKGATFVMQYNNGADSPEKFHYEIHNGWSEISFRSVCVDPITLSPDLANCSGCVKTVDLQYGYFTRANLWGNKSFHINGSKLGMRAEDWAIMAVQDGSEFNVLDVAGRSYVIDCEAPDASITDLLTAAADLIDPIGLAFDSLSVPNVLDAATQVIEFIDTYITSQKCNEVFVGDTTMLSGTYTFDLAPGEYFKASLISGATFGGECHNNGKGFISLNSDFYLAAAVNTKADSTGTVPNYCECEKIGAYALGSMENFTPKSIQIRDSNPVLDMSTIFEDVPYGDLTMRQLAGAYIGSFGPWAPKWNQTGCCSDVQLECHSECAYINGCDQIQPKVSANHLDLPNSRTSTLAFNSTLNDGEGLVRSKNNNFDEENEIKMYPNPVTNELIVDFSGLTDEYHTNANVAIYDIYGMKVAESRINSDEKFIKLDMSNLIPGIYIGAITESNSNQKYFKIIKN